MVILIIILLCVVVATLLFLVIKSVLLPKRADVLPKLIKQGKTQHAIKIASRIAP